MASFRVDSGMDNKATAISRYLRYTCKYFTYLSRLQKHYVSQWQRSQCWQCGLGVAKEVEGT